MKKAPTISYEYHGPYGGDMTFSANWEDETGRYHVWLTPYGMPAPSDTIYCNPLRNEDGTFKNRGQPGYFQTRHLDLRAKRWNHVLIALEIESATHALTAAIDLYQRNEDEKKAKRDNESAERYRAELLRIMAAAPSWPPTVEAIQNMTTEQLLKWQDDAREPR